MTTYKRPIGVYTSVQAVGASGQTEQMANVAALALLFGIVMTGSASYTLNGNAAAPDFNKISGATREALAIELLALAAAIDAAPTS